MTKGLSKNLKKVKFIFSFKLSPFLFKFVKNKVLGVIPKAISANWYKPIHKILDYSTFICPLEFEKCVKEAKKYTKILISENEKSLSDEIKSIFHSLWRAIIWWKK